MQNRIITCGKKTQEITTNHQTIRGQWNNNKGYPKVPGHSKSNTCQCHCQGFIYYPRTYSDYWNACSYGVKFLWPKFSFGCVIKATTWRGMTKRWAIAFNVPNALQWQNVCPLLPGWCYFLFSKKKTTKGSWTMSQLQHSSPQTFRPVPSSSSRWNPIQSC